MESAIYWDASLFSRSSSVHQKQHMEGLENLLVSIVIFLPERYFLYFFYTSDHTGDLLPLWTSKSNMRVMPSTHDQKI